MEIDEQPGLGKSKGGATPLASDGWGPGEEEHSRRHLQEPWPADGPCWQVANRARGSWCTFEIPGTLGP